jgi:hypothetical protein
VCAALYFALGAINAWSESRAGKLRAYLGTFLTFVLNVGLWLVVRRLLGFGKHSEAEWLSDFVIANALALALGVFHWPVGVAAVQPYEAKEEDVIVPSSQMLKIEDKGIDEEDTSEPVEEDDAKTGK